MNEDLISRSVLRKCFAEQCPGDCSSCDCCSATNGKLFCGLIDDAPAIDAVPVRHGKWVYHDDDVMPWNSCSLCGCTAFDLHGANYCPYCGAKMEE